MYSLDINFLNDRPDYKPAERKTPASAGGRTSAVDRTPILIGTAVALAANALVGGVWLVFNQRNAQLQTELTALQAQLGEKNDLVAELEKIEAEAKQTNSEADALATVFNEIKPWSALTQELAELMQIAGVKINSIEQTEPEPAKPATSAKGEDAAAAPAQETAKLEITGNANSFTQLNDFILLINQSPFFDGSTTKLLSASLEDNPTELDVPDSSNSNNELPDLQPVVEYTIETNLSQAKASELLPQLKSKGAVGLVNRIQTLQQKGVIQP
ncbi:PilN domain-containing protein [Capilliphycus salinus ALCB114379]|uniref:PilN domain-containing protein n=1 Tax=Capilliphycus salinus TaxID=2768948 RepID=UPI0039A41204